MASDKGGISALRAAKHLGCPWITARAMLYKIRQAMSHRDSIYRLSNLIELDDTVVGGKRSGKRGRGAEGKVLCSLRWKAGGAGLSCHAGGRQRVYAHGRQFSRSAPTDGADCEDRCAARIECGRQTTLPTRKKVTPPVEANVWLPLVHIMIGNMKKFINGTFHGVSSWYPRVS